MNPEVVNGYKRVMSRILSVTSDDTLPTLVARLEDIDDDVDPLKDQVLAGMEQENYPIHWIAILRFVKLSLVARNLVQPRYESYVDTYQVLSRKQGRDEHEEQLLVECGGFLQRFDDVTGRHDRLVLKILSLIRRDMQDNFNTSAVLDDSFYRGQMSQGTRADMEPLLGELFDICRELHEAVRVIAALDRIRKLIIEGVHPDAD